MNWKNYWKRKSEQLEPTRESVIDMMQEDLQRRSEFDADVMAGTLFSLGAHEIHDMDFGLYGDPQLYCKMHSLGEMIYMRTPSGYVIDVGCYVAVGGQNFGPDPSVESKDGKCYASALYLYMYRFPDKFRLIHPNWGYPHSVELIDFDFSYLEEIGWQEIGLQPEDYEDYMWKVMLPSGIPRRNYQDLKFKYFSTSAVKPGVDDFTGFMFEPYAFSIPQKIIYEKYNWGQILENSPYSHVTHKMTQDKYFAYKRNPLLELHYVEEYIPHEEELEDIMIYPDREELLLTVPASLDRIRLWNEWWIKDGWYKAKKLHSERVADGIGMRYLIQYFSPTTPFDVGIDRLIHLIPTLPTAVEKIVHENILLICPLVPNRKLIDPIPPARKTSHAIQTFKRLVRHHVGESGARIAHWQESDIEKRFWYNQIWNNVVRFGDTKTLRRVYVDYAGPCREVGIILPINQESSPAAVFTGGVIT